MKATRTMVRGRRRTPSGARTVPRSAWKIALAPRGAAAPSWGVMAPAIVLAVTYLMASPPPCRSYPATEARPGGWAGTALGFSYTTEEIRPASSAGKISRGAVDLTLRARLLGRGGLRVHAGGSGPWSDENSSWLLTDFEAEPCYSLKNVIDRIDIDGWLTLAVPAGKEPGGDPWYRGVRGWSYGFGGRLSAPVMGGVGPGHVRVVLDLRYRTAARSGWIYLPHHSIAVRDTSGESNGAVLSWRAGIEMRGERASLATLILREEPLGAKGFLMGRERPLYLIQSAALKAWGPTRIAVSGEALLSGDDYITAFDPRSVAPGWSVSVGLTWEFDL